MGDSPVFTDLGPCWDGRAPKFETSSVDTAGLFMLVSPAKMVKGVFQ